MYHTQLLYKTHYKRQVISSFCQAYYKIKSHFITGSELLFFHHILHFPSPDPSNRKSKKASKIAGNFSK